MPRQFQVHLLWLVGIACWIAPLRSQPLRVGVETDLAPIAFLDERGIPTGFAVELIKAISKEMNFEVEFIVRPRAAMFEDFNVGRIDALSNVVYTKEREAYMAFAVSHLELRSTIFVRKGDRSITAPEHLRNVRIAGIPNTRGQEYLNERRLAPNFVPAATQRDALHAVADGNADATIGTRLIGLKIISEDKLNNVEDSDVQLPELTYRFHVVLHAGDAARLRLINEGLANLRENGTYARLYEKWIGPLEPHRLTYKDMQPYVVPALLLALAGLAALLWQRRIFKQLAGQTEALRKSEERMTLVLEGSEDGFWDWDMKAGTIARSERWASMLGYTLKEVEETIDGGKKLLHPDDLALYEGTQLQIEKKHLSRYAVEYRMKSKSGEWRWILDRGKVVDRAVDGTPLRMAGTHTDITDRKRTEAALRESERLLKRSAQLLEQTQSAAHIGGWELDLRSNRLYWTEETYRIHEVEAKSFEPTVERFWNFFTAESRPTLIAAWEEARRRGTPFDLELEIETAEKHRIQVQIGGQAEMEGDRLVKIYGSIRDITENKNAAAEREKLQRKMLEAQKLESLGVLAGGIAHDFNNLLTVILANASLGRLGPSDARESEERFGHIEEAARRAGDMCRQMLAYAGKGNFVVEKVNLSALVQDTARLLAISISKKARLELTMAPGLPTVEGDASQLRQVVMNLLINAAEALGDTNGEIRLTTRRGRPDRLLDGVAYSFDLPAGECVCLEVSDTGCGMNPATLARIFDPFFTTKFAGRGLGLAAVLGIVRTHHGALSVKSEIGRGTTFTLFLPPASAAAIAVAPAVNGSSNGHAAPDPLPGGAVRSILIADDEPAVLKTTSTVLRRCGFDTVLARDGNEAVQLFRDRGRDFAMVLLDLTMPGLDGAEVLQAIRSMNPDTRVLLMTGYSEQDVFDKIQGQKDVAVLRKPFTQDVLISRVNDVINRV